MAREESAVARQVRADVAWRDGYCRVSGQGRAVEIQDERVGQIASCAGPSEWCHWGPFRRALTRKRDPESRHLVSGSLMLCKAHHDGYDGKIGGQKMRIEALTKAGTDGPLRFKEVT